MKIKRQFRRDIITVIIIITVKPAGCLGNDAAIILVLRLTPSESDCLYRLLHAFECNTDIISRVNGEVISRGEAECNLAISE